MDKESLETTLTKKRIQSKRKSDREGIYRLFFGNHLSIFQNHFDEFCHLY